jgi:hypothetical protein
VRLEQNTSGCLRGCFLLSIGFTHLDQRIAESGEELEDIEELAGYYQDRDLGYR